MRKRRVIKIEEGKPLRRRMPEKEDVLLIMGREELIWVRTNCIIETLRKDGDNILSTEYNAHKLYLGEIEVIKQYHCDEKFRGEYINMLRGVGI